jgi:branched-chain amino acid transport system permease protein
VAAVLVLQLAAYPMPFGVWCQGLILGLLDALVAVGLALVYRANRILNFAQADLGTVPTVLAFGLISLSGVGYVLGILTGLAAAVVLGAVVEWVVIRRFFRAPRLILMIATVGLSQLLITASLLLPGIWTKPLLSNQAVHFPWHLSFTILPVVFGSDHLVALIVAPVALALVALWLSGTDLGVAVRASAERSDRAASLGIPVKRLQTVVWVVASVLSFLGVFLRGAILGLPLTSTLSLGALVVALAALVLGGFTNLVAVGASAVALGVLQQGVAWHQQNRPTLVYAVLAAVVLVALLAQRVQARRAERDTTSSWDAATDVRPLPLVVAHLREVRLLVWGAGAVLVAVAVVLPVWLSTADQLKAASVAVFAVIAVSIVVLSGWAGQVSLGQMGFAAVGATVGALALTEWGFDLSLALLVAGVAGALAAVIVGLPALRVGGLFFAVTTLVFGLAATGWLLNRSVFSWIPNGRIDRPHLFATFDLSSQAAMYEVCLGVLVLTLLALRGLRAGRAGRVTRAVRMNDRAARAYGISAVRTKLSAFAVSGFLAGVAGCLLVVVQQSYAETSYAPTESLNVFTAAAVGGLGSAAGGVIGALYLQGGRWFLPANWQLLPSAIGVLVVLMLLPGGVVELLVRGRDALARLLVARRGLDAPSLTGRSGEHDGDDGSGTPAAVHGRFLELTKR